MNEKKLIPVLTTPPTVILDGVLYTAAKPKVKLWREIMEYQENKPMMSLQDGTQEMFKLMSKAFNNPLLTADYIEDNLELDDMLPLYNDILTWMNKILVSKMSVLPNVESLME